MSDTGNGWSDPGAGTDGGGALPEAGWYPDPEIAGGLRYWDGAAWTEHRHQPEADTAADTPWSDSAPSAGGTAAEQPGGHAPGPATAPGGAASPGWGAPATAPTTAAAGAAPDWAQPTVVRRGVGAGAVVAVAAFALIVGAAGGYGLRMLTEDSTTTTIVTDGGGGQTLDGALTPGDRADVELTGRVLRIPVSIPSGGQYVIEASSSDFDTVLTLYRGGTEVAYNDDGPTGLDSQIATELDAGDYTLELRSWDDRSTGSATVSVR